MSEYESVISVCVLGTTIAGEGRIGEAVELLHCQWPGRKELRRRVLRECANNGDDKELKSLPLALLAIDTTSSVIVGHLRLSELVRFGCESPSNGKEAFVSEVVVRKSSRKAGIGRQLMNEAENIFQRLGFKWSVLEANCDSVPFYQKLGYTSCPHVNRVSTASCGKLGETMKRNIRMLETATAAVAAVDQPIQQSTKLDVKEFCPSESGSAPPPSPPPPPPPVNIKKQSDTSKRFWMNKQL
eukprot:Nk52_evm4s368 gene=Nk52_evmTU4s368